MNDRNILIGPVRLIFKKDIIRLERQFDIYGYEIYATDPKIARRVALRQRRRQSFPGVTVRES